MGVRVRWHGCAHGVCVRVHRCACFNLFLTHCLSDLSESINEYSLPWFFFFIVSLSRLLNIFLLLQEFLLSIKMRGAWCL